MAAVDVPVQRRIPLVMAAVAHEKIAKIRRIFAILDVLA